MIRSTLMTLLLAAAPFACAQDGWISLFNGKDMTGWKVSGAPETFTVKDGSLVANGPVSHLYYDGPVQNHNFKNFELKVTVMTAPGSNGGIYFHTEYQPTGWPAKGFEVQVNHSHTDPIKTGSLYHVKDIGTDVIGPIAKDDQWVTEYITVQGSDVTIKVNDKEVVKWTQPADWAGARDAAGRKLGSGTVALQGHDPKSTVKYKDIMIRPLP